MSYIQIQNELKKLSNPERTKFSINYFPRGGVLGSREDKFYGSKVPETRKLAKKFKKLDFSEIQKLLDSNWHEERLCGLMILKFQVDQGLKTRNLNKLNRIQEFYLHNLQAVDHWDLVDESSHNILGRILVYKLLMDNSRNFQEISDFPNSQNPIIEILEDLAESENLWLRRISIISQFAFLYPRRIAKEYKNLSNYKLPLNICKSHLTDHHHYIQKATGWILREIGKSQRLELDNFIRANIQNFGSICLSYTLEKHSPEEKTNFRKLRKN